MKLIWSPRARDRSAEIVTHIVNEGRPQAAMAWLDGLERRVDLLRDAPLQGRPVPEWFDSRVREIFYKGFRVIHEVGDSKVEIVTIRHMREDLTGSGTEDSSQLAFAAARVTSSGGAARQTFVPRSRNAEPLGGHFHGSPDLRDAARASAQASDASASRRNKHSSPRSRFTERPTHLRELTGCRQGTPP